MGRKQKARRTVKNSGPARTNQLWENYYYIGSNSITNLSGVSICHLAN